MKIISAVTAALVLGSILSACGGDDTKARAEAARVVAYCAALEQAAPQIKAFSPQDPDFKKMQDYFDLMQGLSKKSPASVHPAWSVVNFDYTEIEKAAKAANLDFSSIPKVLKGKVPKDAKPEKFPALNAAFDYLASVNLATANKAIVADAASVCKIDLAPTVG